MKQCLNAAAVILGPILVLSGQTVCFSMTSASLYGSNWLGIGTFSDNDDVTFHSYKFRVEYILRESVSRLSLFSSSFFSKKAALCSEAYTVPCLLSVFLLLVSLAAGIGVWFQWQQTRRCLTFWHSGYRADFEINIR